MKNWPVSASLLLLFSFGSAVACDSTSSSGGSAGQGGSGGGGQSGAAGHYNISRAGDTFSITSGDPNFLSGLGAGGKAGGGSGGNGSSGGASVPACVPSGPTGTPPTTAVCGDGLISITEQCDDANLLPDDACSAACVVTPRAVALHAESNSPLPLSGRELGKGAHPVAAGCNRVAVSFVDRATNPAQLELSTYSRFGVPQTVLSYATATVDDPNPVIAALDNDTFVAAWTDFDDDELGVRLRRIDPQLTTQTAPLFANSEHAFSQHSPDIVFDGTQLVVAWVDTSDPLNGPDLRYRTYSPNLEPTSDDLTLAATNSVEDHVVLAGQDGRWAAAWRSGSAGLETIEVQSGTSHWSVGPFLPGPVDDNPALIFLDPNHLALAFATGSDESASGIANHSHLHAAVLDAAYPGRVESFKIEPKAAPYSLLPQISQSQPSIASLGDRLVIAWHSSAIQGAPEGEEVWAREITWAVSGGSLVVDTTSPERPLPNSGDFRGGDQSRPVLLSSRYWPERRLLSVWEDRSGSFKNLFGKPEVGVQLSRAPSQLPVTPNSGPCLDTILTASPSTQAMPPTVVKLRTAAKCGGALSAEYKFYYTSPDQPTKAVLIRDWSGNSSADWNTSGLPSGRYVVFAYARRPGTSVEFDSYWGFEYFLGHVCNVNPTLSITPTGTQPLGSTLTLSAAATCNGATPEYRFRYAPPGSGMPYVDIGTWSTTPVSWNTAGIPSGVTSVVAYIRAIGNASQFEGAAYGSATLGNSCSAVNAINANPASPQPTGTTVSLSATASCTGGATPEFRYMYIRTGMSNWVQIGNWSTTPVAWNTTGLAVDTYALGAEVRAAGNVSGAEAWGQRTYTLVPDATCSVTLTATNGPVGQGNAVPLSASANCGATPTYRFAHAWSGSTNYTYLTSWGTSTTTTWDTTGISGSYDLVVLARKSTATMTYDAIQKKTIEVGTKCTSSVVNVAAGSGTTLSLNGYAYCDHPRFSYYYAVADGTHLWSAASSPWVTGGVSFGTSLLASGYYEFKVESREGVIGGVDSTSDPVLWRIGPGCSLDYELGHLTGHPLEGGNPLYVGVNTYCDDGVTPEYAFFYLPPGATEYIQFPDTGWQSDSTGILDTTNITVGGTYGVKVLVRGVGQVGFSNGDAFGTFDYAP